MRVLEVRRHTMRRKPGSHLSHDGIMLAREAARQLPLFSRVVTSTTARAVETAVAMGLQIDETLDGLGPIEDGIVAAIGWPSSFSEVRLAVDHHETVAAWGAKLNALWRDVVGAIGDGQQTIIITHGGALEIGVVSALPVFDHDKLGGAAGYCEGVRLKFEKGMWLGAEIIRMHGEGHMINN